MISGANENDLEIANARAEILLMCGSETLKVIDKYYKQQLETYENMRKEALKHKNEIKKILDKLNSSQWEKDEEEISYKILFSEEFYKLLNYINDLLNILNKVGGSDD